MKRLIPVFILTILFSQAAAGKEVRIELRAGRYSYSPGVITVNKGDLLAIKLVSEDVTHGFFLDGYDISGFVHPGETREIIIKADKVGRFTFRCSVTCGEFHPYMIGYLKVRPNINLYAGVSLVFLLSLGSLLLVLIRKKNPSNRLFGFIPMDWRMELTKFKPIRALFKSRWFPLVPLIINLFIFTVILTSGIVGGFSSSGNYNFGIMIVWILWWVILMLFLVPVLGRFWCMVCPFPMFGDWLQRGRLINVGRKKSFGLAKKWPKELRNLWPLTILFFVTTFFSGFFTVRPLASFILLAIIIGFATFISVIYEKRTFCLFFCPVSGFQGLYANFAASEVRVKDPAICKKHTPKTCVVGNENGYGCPWMEQPHDMNRNTYCGMCLECFKTCPYDNMAFNIRPPGTDLLQEPKKIAGTYGRQGFDEAFKGLSMVGIMIVFFLTMQGPFGIFKDMVRATTLGGYFTFLLGHLLLTFLALPGIYSLFIFLSKIMSGDKNASFKRVFSAFSNIFIPLGLGIWAAFSVGIILPNGSYLLHVISDPFAWGWDLFGTANIPWTPFQTGIMPYIQILFLLVGLVFSLEYGYKIAGQVFSKKGEAKRGWIPIAVFLLGINIFFMWLFVG